MTATERKRRERARRRAGLEQYRLELTVETIEALISSGRMTPAAALRRPLVARELEAVLAEWAARWREKLPG